MRIYVAASSDELARAVRWSKKLRSCLHVVVSTWPNVIAEVGASNPPDADRTSRREWALADLAELRTSDLVWILAPIQSHGRGAYWEAATAVSLGIPVVSSGPTQQSIFMALTEEFTTDEEVFELLRTKNQVPIHGSKFSFFRSANRQ